MNAIGSQLLVPYLSDGIAGIEGYISGQAQNFYFETELIHRLHKDISKSKPILKSLANKKIINISHYCSNIYTLIYSMIEEQFELLARHQINPQDLLVKWHHLKIELSYYRTKCTKDSQFIKNLESFLQELIKTQISVGIETAAFHSSINEFIKLASFIHIGDVTLSYFFSSDKKNYHTARLPAGALFNALKRNAYLLKKQFSWIEPHLKKLFEEIDEWSPPEHPTYEKFKRLLLSFRTYLKAVRKLIPHLDYFIHCLAENRKISLPELQQWQEKVKNLGSEWIKIELREIPGYDQKIMKKLKRLYQHYDFMVNIGDFFFNDLLARSSQILISTGHLQKALNSLSPKERNSYLDQFFPIFIETQVATPARKKKHKKTSSPKKQNKATEQLQKAKKIKTSNIEEPKTATAPSKPTPNPLKINSLKNLSWKIYHYANFCRGEYESFLLQAAWHLEKVSTIQDIFLSSKGNLINLFTAFSFHLSHTLEQLLIYRTIQNGTDYKKIHNLKLLQMLSSLPNLPIIEQFYLATYWSRYPFEELEGWKQATHFYKRPLPYALKTIADLTQGSHFYAKEAFVSYFETTCKELEEAIVLILPLPSQLSRIPPSLTSTVCVEPFSFVSDYDLSSVITKLKEVTQCVYDQSFFKVKESLLHTQMLANSLTAIDQSQSIPEFTFWTSRILFLIQQSLEALMHSMEIIALGEKTTVHDVNLLAKMLEYDLKSLGDKLKNASKKLKYPFATRSEGLCSFLIDQMTSLTIHPDMEQHFEYTSSYVPDWHLPLKDVTRESIANHIKDLLIDWQESMLHLITFFKS